jgi:hypothetical protein
MSEELSLEVRLARAEARADELSRKYAKLRTHTQMGFRQFGADVRINDTTGAIENVAGGQRMLVDRASEYIRMGQDFEKVLNEIKSNMLLKSQWDKLLMSMRLTENRSE